MTQGPETWPGTGPVVQPLDGPTGGSTAGPTARPPEVTVRSSRWPLVVGWLVAAAFEAGLIVAVVEAVTGRGGGFEGVGTAGTIFGWILVAVFLVLIGLSLVVGAAAILSGATVDHVDGAAAWRTTSGKQTARVDRATAASITYLPALRATWARSTSPVDSRTRGTMTGVGYDRLVVVDRSGARVEFSSTTRHWPEVVDTLETWTAQAPDLAADEGTRAFLATPYPRPHRRLLGWAGPIAAMLAVGIGGLVLTVRTGTLTWSVVPSLVFGGAMVGAILWWGLVRPLAAFGQAVVVSVGRRDPWAAFAPDDHGRYNWLLTGRTTVLRAPARRSLPGLLWRWPMLALIGLAPVLVVVQVARLLR